MRISGCTIVRNGVKFDYPFLESISSALPICDEFVVNVGASEDATEERIRQLALGALDVPASDAAKIKVFRTDWPLGDPEKRKGGKILAEQTNLALAACQGEWCLYLQADEVLHEEDRGEILAALGKYDRDAEVEAFVFNYVHFYADYSTVQASRSSYRREIRMIRNGLGIQSTGDAQSFRFPDGRKPKAALLNARIYHYGWVRPQETMKSKTGFMDTLYHEKARAEAPATGGNYLYKRLIGLRRFGGTHPASMAARVASAGNFDFSRAPRVFQMKDAWKIVSGWIERFTGWRPFEYKSYRIVRR